MAGIREEVKIFPEDWQSNLPSRGRFDSDDLASREAVDLSASHDCAPRCESHYHRSRHHDDPHAHQSISPQGLLLLNLFGRPFVLLEFGR